MEAKAANHPTPLQNHHSQVMQPLTGNFRAWLYWAETSLYGGETNLGLGTEYFVLCSEYYTIFGPILSLRVHDHLHKIHYLSQSYNEQGRRGGNYMGTV